MTVLDRTRLTDGVTYAIFSTFFGRMRFSTFFSKKVEPKNFTKSFIAKLTQQKTEFLFVKYNLVYSKEESRRTLRTDDFHFLFETDSRGSEAA